MALEQPEASSLVAPASGLTDFFGSGCYRSISGSFKAFKHFCLLDLIRAEGEQFGLLSHWCAVTNIP